ncbi:hypothetical protein A8H39_01495 [Paraburkholderia fungorum]|uniref:hypothetical protein n=1 Tax=Paraburkholderia fungorum TaxID=134537 RepID=UPI000487CA72|nr:hypothetical protein [Paraburkholderia fungorum]PNE59848.1 hypothetical protein A8H39_01495 [Paraburkholderia fungorum]
MDPKDIQQMTPNQKRALSNGLAALETMAVLWGAEVRLSEMAARIAAVEDESERTKRIAAMIEQGFMEGAYRHFLDAKEQTAPAPTFEEWARTEGLISESRGVRFVNSMCGIAEKAWDAATLAGRIVEEAGATGGAHPIPSHIAADLERSDWMSEEALRWYADGKHFDVVNGRTRILDTGAIASAALKRVNAGYHAMKGADASFQFPAQAGATSATNCQNGSPDPLEQAFDERKRTCEAIDGAMSFGYLDLNEPPAAHWLAQWWAAGQAQRAAMNALRYLDRELTQYLNGMPADETSRKLRDAARDGLAGIDSSPLAASAAGTLSREFHALIDVAAQRALTAAEVSKAGGVVRAYVMLGRPAADADARPIPMLLFCPKCGAQHVDAPEHNADPHSTREADESVESNVQEWTNPPHRSHLCHACGTVWRPADVATTGVSNIDTHGNADNWHCGESAAVAPAKVSGVKKIEGKLQERGKHD